MLPARLLVRVESQPGSLAAVTPVFAAVASVVASVFAAVVPPADTVGHHRGGTHGAVLAVDARYGDQGVVTGGPGGVDRGLGSGVECHGDDHAGQQNRVGHG